MINRIPDAFRIDPIAQPDRKIRAYRELLAGIAQTGGGTPTVISLQHQHDLNVNSTKKLGLKCCFITEVRNEDGTTVASTCNKYAARYQAYCPQHQVAVSVTERRMYKGFAVEHADPMEFHRIRIGEGIKIKVPNLNEDGYRHVFCQVARQSVHQSYHNYEKLVRYFGRHYRQSAR